jgi:hypothetical protein
MHDWCKTDHSSNQVFANRALVSCQPVPRRCITVAILPPFVLENVDLPQPTKETIEYFRKNSAFEPRSEFNIKIVAYASMALSIQNKKFCSMPAKFQLKSKCLLKLNLSLMTNGSSYC